MRTSARFLASWGVILFFPFLVAAQSTDSRLLTVAEKSNFQATSTHAEVVALCQEISKSSPLALYSEFGTTVEGRKLPLLVIANPPLGTPGEAALSGKVIVLAFANIHAGEVDGKEGVLMLARELALAKDHPLFKDLVVMIAPIYNADGNDKMDPKNRPGQVGPVLGMGRRENANGLDLNRDFVKLDSPEARALVRLMNQWNPHVIVDCHTTNGSLHRHTITYDTCKHPVCDERIIQLSNEKMMPEVTERLDKKGGWKSFYYGNFNRDRTEWATYGHQPRFSTQYIAMRNRIGILSESYSYATYKDRVLASKDFVHSILDFSASHRKEIITTLNNAVVQVLEENPTQRITLRARTVAMPGRYTVLGYEEKEENGRRVRTDVPKEYAVTYIGKAQATHTVARPTGYYIPKEFTRAVENLKLHGIGVQELREKVEMPVEIQRVNKLTRENREFQKHRMIQLETEMRKEVQNLPAGGFLIKTAQPLGNFAAFLLEPMADDGLTTWNFFDEGLTEGKDHPVLRLLEWPSTKAP